MALTFAQLVTYLETEVQTEILDYCAGATDSVDGQARFKHGLATVIAKAVKHYNDNVFPDAELSPTGSVSTSTRVNPQIT